MNSSAEYRIIDIGISQFATFESGFDPKNIDFRLDTNFSYGVDPDKNILICLMAATFFQEGNSIIKIESQVTFEFNKSFFYNFIDKNIFFMPESHVKTLTNILYNSTRGMLAAKLEKSPMQGVILPIADMDEIVVSPLKILLSSDS
ncbi:MAG: hypothetical protein K2J82_01395 [Muribaculaceae bacterium]|nr:hypothetical protein [Muribaculaceae bacterium]MDE6753248.1 hypothetical protein [Muribaculaceae bacterium]